MKQYKVNLLTIEITRRCNKNCSHCMRGNSENLTMPKEIIDRVFDEVQNVQTIVLGNGEALLEMDTLEYFLKKLLQSPWTANHIEITTNGTIYDKRIVDYFESFCLNRNGRFALIRISNDMFHNPDEYIKAYTFYRPLVEAANNRIRKHTKDSKILLKYTCKTNGEQIPLIYDGRAVKLIDDASTPYIHGKHTVYQLYRKHRVKIVGDTVPCALQILANGNISFNEQSSYRQMDSLSFGNIMEDHISSLIDQHNEHCLLLCSEADRLCSNRDYMHYANTTNNQILFSKITEIICERIVGLRYQAHLLYPDVAAQDVIEALPFPASSEIERMVFDIYQNINHDKTPVQWNNHTPNAIEQNLYAILSATLFYLSNQDIDRKYPYYLFGNTDDIRYELSRKFKNRSASATLNNKNYPCDMVLGNGFSIDYSEDFAVNAWKEYRRDLHSYLRRLSS